MAAEIKYNGSVISSPGAGQTATLKCAGMKMESDVVVEVAEQSGGSAECDCFEDVTELPEVVDESKVYRFPTFTVKEAIIVAGGSVMREDSYNIYVVDELPPSDDSGAFFVLKSTGIAYVYYGSWLSASAIVAMLMGIQLEDKGFVTDEELAAGGLADGVYMRKEYLVNYGIPTSADGGAIYDHNADGWCKVSGGYIRTLVDGHDHDGSGTECLIPNGTIRVRPYAFYDISAFRSVSIPSTVDTIWEYAFSNTALERLSVPETVSSIGEKAFADCWRLESIEIPSVNINIKTDAFANSAYYNDENNWQNNALYIGHHLIKLKEDFVGAFVVKTDTKVLHENAIDNVVGLTSIIFPEGFRRITNNAVGNCPNITTIDLPESISYIGSNFMYRCTNVHLTIRAKTPPSCSNSWGSKLSAIYVPEESVSVYKETYPWSGLASIIFPIEE